MKIDLIQYSQLQPNEEMIYLVNNGHCHNYMNICSIEGIANELLTSKYFNYMLLKQPHVVVQGKLW